MAKRGVRETSTLEEALKLSSIQAPALSMGNMQQDSGDDDEDDEDVFEDADLSELNNPDLESFTEPPILGSRPKVSDMFGQEADTFGRATSPKLYAQAAQFPTAVQFRVWRWENGVPVALGAIDAEATEEDFVRAFKEAMPKPGEGRFQFRMRPIDIRGQELGKEFTINISEHHSTLKQLRARQEQEKMERETPMWGGGGRTQTGGDIIVNPSPTSDAGASYAEEMGRMFEQAVESAERRSEVLQSTLEQERERLREEEQRRAQERISMAERSADVVQKMTEKLMASDRLRADEAMKAQRDHGQLLLSTLTTVFQQQQEAARQQTERMREVDMARMSQDREFFDRQRSEMESRRVQERDEEERRRLREREDWERRREEDRHRLEMEAKRIEDQRRYELEQIRIEAQRRESEIERRREMDKDDSRTRTDREKQEIERREREMERLREQERESMRLWLERERQDVDRRREMEREEARRHEIESERRRDLEREEIRARTEKERLEAERVRQQMLEERERWRQEMEDKRRNEQLDWERKLAAERDERERRERSERERWEREKLEMSQRLERERLEWDRKESLRREDLTREEARRRDEMMLQQKQLEMSAQRDREHSERMMEMARLEREAQREAQSNREKAEREAREISDRERQRQHELQLREMEISKERDREHAERMISLQKAQNSGGLTAITDMLGMETPELLGRIFGGGGEGESKSSWADVIPKVLGSLADVGKAVVTAQAAQAQAMASQGAPSRGSAAQSQTQVAVQTPDGVRMIPASVLAQMQAMQASGNVPVPAGRRPTRPSARNVVADIELPDEGFVPPEQVSETPSDEEKQSFPSMADDTLESSDNPDDVGKSPEFLAAEKVNTIKRGKDAKIPLPKQRTARKAIVALGAKLAETPESDWIAVVTEAITAEFAIYSYIKAVTVYAALAEAKLAPDLAERIVKALRESGMIPDDVPFTEEDFQRVKAAEAEGAA